MSETGINKDKLELDVNAEINDKLSDGYNDLHIKFNELKIENYKLKQENSILKDIVVENNKEKFENSLIREEIFTPLVNFPKIGKDFYFQIILGISVIILILGFHILYLAVTSCLMYSEGNPNCWIVSWLGINLHASFYLDIMLYSLISIQIILIILIVREKVLKKTKFP